MSDSPALILRRHAESRLKDAERFEQAAADSTRLAGVARDIARQCLDAAKLLEPPK